MDMKEYLDDQIEGFEIESIEVDKDPNPDGVINISRKGWNLETVVIERVQKKTITIEIVKRQGL